MEAQNELDNIVSTRMRVDLLERVIGGLGEALAVYGAHRLSCAVQYGDPCDCGYRIALETAIAFRSKSQTEEDDEAEDTPHAQGLSDKETL